MSCHVIIYRKIKKVQGNQRHVLFGLCLWPWSNLSSSKKRLGHLLPPPGGQEASRTATRLQRRLETRPLDAERDPKLQTEAERDGKGFGMSSHYLGCCGRESGFKTLIFQRLGGGEFLLAFDISRLTKERFKGNGACSLQKQQGYQ